MTQISNKFAFTAAALAVSALLSACGGGDASPPPDIVAPTLAITDSEAGATATGAVTFTFTFSEDVGSSFTAEDIAVSGGSAGALTKLSATSYTLIVTPAAGSTGSVGVSVDAAKFADVSSNANTATTAATQAFNTVVVTPGTGSGSTGTCSGAGCVDFSGTAITFSQFENQAGGTAELANDPKDASNRVAKFVKKPGDGDYFGTVINAVGPVALTATDKTVTMRVLTPTAGTNVLLKFEGGPGGATTELDVATTKADEWETLSFVMPATGTFTTVVLFPGGRSGVSADKAMYFDELKFPAASSGGGGSGAFAGGVFADDYVGTLPATAKSTQGGDVGFFLDDRLFNTKSYDYGGVSGTAQDPAGVHNFYYGLGLNAPAITDAYFGAYVKSPGNGVVDVSTFTNLKLNVWGPDQLFKAGNFPALNVVMQGAAVAGCGSASGASEVETTFNTTTQGAASIYTLPLSSFTLKFACSGETTVAQVLARIAQVNVILKGTQVQYLSKDPDGVAFTNGLNIGSIKFN